MNNVDEFQGKTLGNRLYMIIQADIIKNEGAPLPDWDALLAGEQAVYEQRAASDYLESDYAEAGGIYG